MTRLQDFEAYAIGTNEYNVLHVVQAYLIAQKCSPEYSALAYWVSQIGNAAQNSTNYYAVMYQIFVAGAPEIYDVGLNLNYRIDAVKALLNYAHQDSAPQPVSDAKITEWINGGANFLTANLMMQITAARVVTACPRPRNRMEVSLVGSNDRHWGFKDGWAMVYVTANAQTVTDYLAWDAAGRP